MAKDKNSTHLVVTDRPTATPQQTPESCLGIAAVCQVVAFIAAAAATLPFAHQVAGKLVIPPGVAPIAAGFVPMWAVFLFGVWFTYKRQGRTSAFGSKPVFKVSDISFVLVGFGCQIAVGILYTLAKVNQDDVSKPAKDLLGADKSTVGIVVLGLLVGIGAPIVEEMFYRGFVLTGLTNLQRKNRTEARPGRLPWLSIIVVALIFAAVHLEPLQFPALFLVGLACAFCAAKFRRLGPSIAIHMGFNLTTVIVMALTG